MKKKKTISRILAVLFAAVMAVLFLIVLGIVLFPGKKLNAAEEQSGSCGDNVIWTLDAEGTLTISGTGATKDYNKGSDSSPFNSKTEIKKVVIESGVTSIGSALLYNCSNLTEVSIPDSVTSIGNNAFEQCTKIINITLPDSVTSVNDSAFANCTKLTNLTLSNSLTSIGQSAFYWCTSIISITLPDSVTSIGQSAFRGCGSLSGITIPNSVTFIGINAFVDCNNLTSITIKESLYEQCKAAFTGISSDKFNFLYNLRYTTDGNGSVMGPSETYDSSAESFTMSPNKGFTTDKVTWSDGIGDPVELKAVNGKYTMPKPSDSFDYDSDTVTISVTFRNVNHEITFKNYDGTVLEKKKVPEGEIPEYTGTIVPSKPSAGGYSFEFAGWDTAPVAVTGPATYTATYTRKEIEYKVTFVDDDGVEICSDTVKYHEVPVFNGNNPVRKETDTHTFTFVGWSDGKTTYSLDQGLPQIESDTTFTPVFDPVVKPVYTVGEVKGDGVNSDIVIDVHRNVDDENCLTYFLGAAIDGTEMTVNDQYTATKGSTIITIKKDYASTLASGEHEVTINFNDGSVSTKVTIAPKVYEITYKNYDGTVLENKKVTYGDVPSYTGTIVPSKPSAGGYSYSFAGWDPIPTAVTGPATYTATYTRKEIKYKVTFVDDDGAEICSDTVKYHEVPVFNGNIPVRKETDTHTFTFAGWTDGKTTYRLDQGLPQIESDTTFSPVFDTVVKPVYTVGEVKGDGVNSDIVIDVHRNVDDENCLTYFLGAAIDGTEMKVTDQYTVTKGSTIITIKKDYASTLASGKHEVTVNFNDGSVSTKVTIAAKTNTNTVVPATGDATDLATYIGLALIAAACACGAGVVLLKKR